MPYPVKLPLELIIIWLIKPVAQEVWQWCIRANTQAFKNTKTSYPTKHSSRIIELLLLWIPCYIFLLGRWVCALFKYPCFAPAVTEIYYLHHTVRAQYTKHSQHNSILPLFIFFLFQKPRPPHGNRYHRTNKICSLKNSYYNHAEILLNSLCATILH